MDFKGRPLTLEVSRLADQANGAVLAKYGDTTVLATAVMDKEDRPVDFLPLTVDYEQKFYAIGKILGSRFMRREGRASDNAILCGRMIDRTIRPLFDYRVRRNIQVVITVLSYDGENDHVFVGLLAASTALGISDIPWNGPVAGSTVAKINGALVVSPKVSELSNTEFESFIAGTKDVVNMIELDGREAGDKDIIKGFEMAHEEIGNLVAFQDKIIKEIGKPKSKLKLADPSEDTKAKVKAFLEGKLEGAIYVAGKVERQDNLAKVKADLFLYLKTSGVPSDELGACETYFETEIDETVHKNILKNGKRPDGRALDEIRELYAETHTLRRLHGTALFMRGNTQALGVVTLDSPEAEQLIENMSFSGKKHFMLHYNFPNYSVGETGSFRGPGRREIGHGALAEKALRAVIPEKEEFPYTIRVVSETLSSNGSSSMATVCAGSMALMDAGVPIKKAVGGIAMGLMSDEAGNYKILTDLQGPEDFYGDMDFKVAGTRDGITAIQLDVKIRGVNMKMISETLAQANSARMKVLDVMDAAIKAPRPSVSEFAPVILKFKTSPDNIGLIIGPGGKTINGIIEKTKVLDISIEEDGRVYITGASLAVAEAALKELEALTKDYFVGDIVEGKIIKILDFGAILDLGGGKDGMIHVSELKDGYVKKVEDVVKMGDFVRAKVIRKEEGKIGLSLKAMK